MKLIIKNVSFSYASVRALDKISIEIDEGEIVSLVGPNGAGKSTLLKCIDRILRPQKGVIFLDGKEVSRISSKELARMMGYVPQNMVEVFPFTVFDIVLMGRRPHIGWRVNEKDVEIVAQTLKFMGIEELGARYFDELSGGEKQKVAIARAIAQEPKILLLDEPTSNLDIRHQLEVMVIIRKLVQERGISAIMAIHDLNLASRFSDRLVMFKNHQIFTIGKPELVLNPKNIRETYGVEAQVTNGCLNKPHIIPIAPV